MGPRWPPRRSRKYGIAIEGASGRCDDGKQELKGDHQRVQAKKWVKPRQPHLTVTQV